MTLPIFLELRDDEGIDTKSMMRKDNPTSSSSYDSSPDAEATIAKLQQHDDLVSDKIIKSLSTLKEPPESLNLGGGESRKLIRNGSEEEGSEDIDRGISSFQQHQPSTSTNNNEESLLDPVKAQERAEELKAKLEREKELENAVDRSEKETHSVALKTEEALDALDGKPLAKAESGSVDRALESRLSTDKKINLSTPIKEAESSETKHEEIKKQEALPVIEKKETTETKHEETKQQDAPLVTEKKETTNKHDEIKTQEAPPVTEKKEAPSEKKNGDEKTVITTNQIQSPKENFINDKPSEQSQIKIPANDTQSQTKNVVITPPQKDKIIAENATVSTQVVDVLKGMGQIKESAPKTVLNKTLDNEEKETKEAVSDLNVAIGILEKKLSLINQAKSTGDKKSIYLVDGESKKPDKDDVAAASRSQIELDNSLKLLEKVMNVAKRVGKPKQKSEVASVPPPQNQSEKKITNTQRSHIQPSIRSQQPMALVVQENAQYFPQQSFIPSQIEEYDLLEDENNNKRQSINRYPTVVGDSFIVPVMKRNKIPALKNVNSQRQTYTRSYTRYYNNNRSNNNNNWNYRRSALTRPFYPYSNYNKQFYYYQQPWSQYPRY